jgi:hypothetical protein
MHPNRREELDLFKSRINLTEYASAQGYVLDRKHSSRNSVAIRGPSGDKVIIARDARDGNWIYFSVTDEEDNGTIIDFVTRRHPLNLGEVRKELRPWVGLAPNPPPRPPVTAYQKDVEPITRDLAEVLARFAGCTPIVHGHRYLEEERGIPRTVLEDPRFAGRIYTDRYQNAVFPHRDRNGICGLEIRNYRFRGFSKGGEKGVWYSQALPEDTTLIICESGIDVLSYHVLHRPAQAHYFSIAGEMNPLQKILLGSAMQKLPHGGIVIAATDNDPGGIKLAREIREIAEAAARQDLGVIDHRPETEGQDWNDVQRALARSRSPAPPRPGQPANLGPT